MATTLHVGQNYQTSLSQGICGGGNFESTYGIMQGGGNFQTSLISTIQGGSNFCTSLLTQAAKVFYIDRPLASTWLSPTYNSSYKGADDPTIPPEVILAHFIVYTGTIPAPIVLESGEIQYSSNLTDVSSIDLAPYIKTFSMDMNLGGKWRFDATFVEHDRGNLDQDGKIVTPGLLNCLETLPSDLNPFYYGTNSCNNYIVQHKFDISRQIIITLLIGNPQIGYQAWPSPPFAPGIPHFDGFTLTWGGEDLSVILEQEYRNFPTGDITPTSPQALAWETLIAIGNMFSFPKFQIQFPNYQIRELRMQKGKPIDWVDKICRPYQALRTWIGGELTFLVPPNPHFSSSSFTLSDFMIDEQGFEMVENTGWKNSFTLARLQDQAGMYGSAQCTGGHCIGRTLDIHFSQPLTNVDIRTSVIGPASLLAFTYFFKGAVVSGGPDSGPSYRGGGAPVDEVQATFMPTWNQVTASYFGVGAINTSNAAANAQDYGYSAYAFGGVASANNFATTYTFKYTDTTGSVPEFGIRPEKDGIEDPIIPTVDVAKAYLAAVINQNLRRVWKLSFQTAFVNFIIYPGMVIGLVDWTTMDGTVNWLVEKIKIVMDENGFWTQKFECYRGIFNPMGQVTVGSITG